MYSDLAKNGFYECFLFRIVEYSLKHKFPLVISIFTTLSNKYYLRLTIWRTFIVVYPNILIPDIKVSEFGEIDGKKVNKYLIGFSLSTLS